MTDQVGGEVRSRRDSREEGQLMLSPEAMCPWTDKHIWLVRPLYQAWDGRKQGHGVSGELAHTCPSLGKSLSGRTKDSD